MSHSKNRASSVSFTLPRASMGTSVGVKMPSSFTAFAIDTYRGPVYQTAVEEGLVGMGGGGAWECGFGLAGGGGRVGEVACYVDDLGRFGAG